MCTNDQIQNAHYFGYATAQYATLESVIELALLLSDCPTEKRIETYEKVIRRQCEFELTEPRIFESFNAGMSIAALELQLALSQQLDASTDFYDSQTVSGGVGAGGHADVIPHVDPRAISDGHNHRVADNPKVGIQVSVEKRLETRLRDLDEGLFELRAQLFALRAGGCRLDLGQKSMDAPGIGESCPACRERNGSVRLDRLTAEDFAVE